jgi:hypothetical protein
MFLTFKSDGVTIQAILLGIVCFYFLWLCTPKRAMAFSTARFLYHKQQRATVGRTPLDE